MGASCQVVADRLTRRGFCAVDEHLHAALLRLDHDRLLAQAAHHVERALRFAAEGELQDVLLDAALDHLPQLLGDPEEAVRGAEAVQALVRAPVIVILHPEPDPFAGGLEAVELGTVQELLPDGLPEALDLAEGHGVVGPALEVVHPVLLELGLEAGGAPPTRELPALVGEQLLGHPVLRHGPAVDLEDVLRRLAAEDVEPHHVAGVIVDKADQVGVLAAQAEGEDVGLPELVRRGALEGARRSGAPRALGLGLREQVVRVQLAAHRLPADRQQAHPPEEVADLLDPEVGVAALERDGLRLHRGRHLRCPVARLPRLRLQARLALRAILPNPRPQRAQANVEVAGDLRDGEAFLYTELDRLAPELHRMDVRVRCPPSSRPLRSLLLARTLAVPVHGFHSFGVLLGTPGRECHPFSSRRFAHDLVASPAQRYTPGPPIKVVWRRAYRLVRREQRRK
jgi:hypothetical protein